MVLKASQPEDFARALLSRFGLAYADDLYALANNIGLKIKEVESQGFEGALLRVPNKPKGIIAVRKDIREDGRKRFTIAHEIGHFVMPGHGAINNFCLSDDIETSKSGVPEQEKQANRFASEILLPTALIQRIANHESASLATAKFISSEYRTSLTAAALKCVEVTSERCAVIYSTKNLIKWSKSNEYFRCYVRSGEKLDSDSLAFKLLTDNEGNELTGPVPVECWVNSSNLISGAKIWEESISMPFYKGVLTILTITEKIEQATARYEEEPLLKELDPNEFTVNRRRWPG